MIGCNLTLSSGNMSKIDRKPLRCKEFACALKHFFYFTNNEVKYKASILGLGIKKNMGVAQLNIFGDLDLIVDKIRGICQSKYPRVK